ncbi:conserved hypothetical protein [Theileria orientalis strain Shintoku]|uniref:Uncharacterized protein n=1 Tax=Theileria orientalis strain Shintoku TaxID=869250 RepID=J7M8M5_THEOR|nr:conserved hypothetical protein [Theileria orientalis strain Shintoku]BAM42428.1 conserved hypothetical protein [Theileria orientalis strain Shintoku]|eukprot:XP_009692729.1 conserved hypothetical protein [Theileria orientalis strain Shintoku]
MDDKMDGTVTFQLENICSYECVTVTKLDDVPEKGFIKCTHKPLNEYANVESCVKYNNSKLRPSANDTENETLQDQIYKSINVILCKTENKDKTDDCVPLLVELNTVSNGIEYYVNQHNPKNDGVSKWVKLSEWLKEVLPQLGLGIKRIQLGFYTLKALLEKVGVSVKNVRKDLTKTLNKIEPDKLKKLLEQKIGDIENQKPLLNYVLLRIKFELSNSVIILLEKKPNENYDHSKISKLIKPKDVLTIMNQTTNVHFVTVKNGEDALKNSKIEIVFFLYGIKIETYNDKGTKLECVYYDEEDKVRVFYYDEDPRPLLIMYKNKAYKPKNIDSYYEKWVFVEIKESESVDLKKGSQLLDILCELTYYFNPVKLEANDHRLHAGAKYITQRFYKPKKIVSIETEVFGDDLNCYKEYVHQSGSPGHALGEISLNGYKLFANYEEYKSIALSQRSYRFPDNVTAYYYMYDKKHCYPLMIELHYLYYFDEKGFKESADDFYKLDKVSEGKSIKWVKIGNDSSKGGQNQSDKDFLEEIERLSKENSEYISDLNDYEDFDNSEESPKYLELEAAKERKFKEIREELGIVYEKSRKNLILATANNCKEGPNVFAIVGSVLTIGLLGVGVGVAYFKYSSSITHLYRKLF